MYRRANRITPPSYENPGTSRSPFYTSGRTVGRHFENVKRQAFPLKGGSHGVRLSLMRMGCVPAEAAQPWFWRGRNPALPSDNVVIPIEAHPLRIPPVSVQGFNGSGFNSPGFNGSEVKEFAGFQVWAPGGGSREKQPSSAETVNQQRTPEPLSSEPLNGYCSRSSTPSRSCRSSRASRSSTVI